MDVLIQEWTIVSWEDLVQENCLLLQLLKWKKGHGKTFKQTGIMAWLCTCIRDILNLNIKWSTSYPDWRVQSFLHSCHTMLGYSHEIGHVHLLPSHLSWSYSQRLSPHVSLICPVSYPSYYIYRNINLQLLSFFFVSR